MKKDTKTGIIVFIILIIFTGGCVVYARWFNKQNATPKVSIANPTANPSGVSSVNYSYNSGKEYIAAVYVEGTMEAANSTYNQKWLLSTINKLKNDSNNVAIAMYVNSPGGGVYQADEVYYALTAYKQTGKKLYVYMGPTAASGGYYISCPADKIYANRNTITGSIGVIAGQLIDATELLDNLGITIEAIHSGRNKLMGNFYEEITEEQEDILQSISDECYNQFVTIVAENRGLSLARVRELADGRIYSAAQAMQNHLIDRIDSWDNMIITLQKVELKMDACKVIAYRYEHKQTFRESLFGMISRIQNKEAASKLGVPAAVMDDLNNYNTYPAYLYRQ
ncbi:MAG: signal peptide peptidase SppA [Treponema sp.]|nr:signal peptide peptidase SppA [Treponema sp.]